MRNGLESIGNGKDAILNYKKSLDLNRKNDNTCKYLENKKIM